MHLIRVLGIAMPPFCNLCVIIQPHGKNLNNSCLQVSSCSHLNLQLLQNACLQADAENSESELDVNDNETNYSSDPSISQSAGRWLVALDRCKHHILFGACSSTHSCHGVLGVYCWENFPDVFGLFVKASCCLSAGCNILYICFGSVSLAPIGNVGCYSECPCIPIYSAIYCRKQQRQN